jgi:integrase
VFGRLILELEASLLGRNETHRLPIAELLLAFQLHADRYYRGADGKPTIEIYEVNLVIRAIFDLYSDLPVAEFGPLRMKAALQLWVKEGRSRSECSRRLGVVKRIFKWGVSQQLDPVTVYQAITTVPGLQKGRTEAREMDPVLPVDDATVDATLPHLNRHVRGLVEFQRLTGCRPGEACSIRRCDIDTGGAVWLYKPPHHKTAHRGKSRTIAIGPRAQELLKQFFTTCIDDFLFSPIRESQERGKTWRAGAKRAPRERYDRTSYTRAIARATAAAEVAHWHPNQLRHTHATKVRKAFTLEHAGAALGHSKMSATEIYAERDAGLAVEAAAKLG